MVISIPTIHIQSRGSSPSTPTPSRGLVLPNSPLRSPSPVQSLGSSPLTLARNSPLHERGETASESRKRQREQPILEKASAKAASPPRPKPHQKKAVAMRPLSSLTCAPAASTGTPSSVRSARKHQSGECLPLDQNATKCQRTSLTRLPDSVVQDACKLFLSINFSP